jgi:predicted aspartyl protease
MKAGWIFNVAVWMMLASAGAAAGFAETIPFRLRSGHLIIVSVWVNDTGPHEFMLDTGASTTLVRPEFARRLGLRPIDRIELVTAAGSQILVRSELARLRLGSQQVTGVETLLSELREVRAALPGVQGVLGQNFLSGFDWLLDYRAQQLEFDPTLEGRLRGAHLPLETHTGRWLVRAPVNGRRSQFVPDSGLPTLLLFDGRKLRLDWAPDAAEERLLRTDFGRRITAERRVRTLQLGPVTFTDLPVVTLPANPARVEDGLLPLRLFARIYFNPRRGYVIFNPGCN